MCGFVVRKFGGKYIFGSMSKIFHDRLRREQGLPKAEGTPTPEGEGKAQATCSLVDCSEWISRWFAQKPRPVFDQKVRRNQASSPFPGGQVQQRMKTTTTGSATY